MFQHAWINTASPPFRPASRRTARAGSLCHRGWCGCSYAFRASSSKWSPTTPRSQRTRDRVRPKACHTHGISCVLLAPINAITTSLPFRTYQPNLPDKLPCSVRQSQAPFPTNQGRLGDQKAGSEWHKHAPAWPRRRQTEGKQTKARLRSKWCAPAPSLK